MNRANKRALDQNNKLLTRIARKITIKRLKVREIDYTVVSDRIISTRQKDVQMIYDNAMLEAISLFNQSNGSIAILKKIYNLK